MRVIKETLCSRLLSFYAGAVHAQRSMMALAAFQLQMALSMAAQQVGLACMARSPTPSQIEMATLEVLPHEHGILTPDRKKWLRSPVKHAQEPETRGRTRILALT